MNAVQDLPPKLHNAVIVGLAMLLALRLTGTPAMDTVVATAQAWSNVLAFGRDWDEEQDVARFQTGFLQSAAVIDRWPAPKDLLDKLPPRPERMKLEYKHDPSPAERAAAKEFIHSMKSKLAGAPCFNANWMYAPKGRSVEECKRIYEEQKKGKRNEQARKADS